jgi:hypothetical protein
VGKEAADLRDLEIEEWEWNLSGFEKIQINSELI